MSCYNWQYLQLRNISVGNHAYEKKGAEETAMTICQYFYKRGAICPGNDTFDIDPEIETGEVPKFSCEFWIEVFEGMKETLNFLSYKIFL